MSSNRWAGSCKSWGASSPNSPHSLTSLPEAEMAPSSRAHLGEMPLPPEGVGF